LDDVVDRLDRRLAGRDVLSANSRASARISTVSSGNSRSSLSFDLKKSRRGGGLGVAELG
jgi:hypothetical protein